MTRLLLALFGKKYEPCKSCEVLRESLEYERTVNRELVETLTSIVKPIPIVVQENQTPRPIAPKGVTWTRRRHEIEKADREAAKIVRTSPLAAKPDNEITKVAEVKSVGQLEMELGLEDNSDADKESSREGVH